MNEVFYTVAGAVFLFFLTGVVLWGILEGFVAVRQTLLVKKLERRERAYADEILKNRVEDLEQKVFTPAPPPPTLTPEEEQTGCEMDAAELVRWAESGVSAPERIVKACDEWFRRVGNPRVPVFFAPSQVAVSEQAWDAVRVTRAKAEIAIGRAKIDAATASLERLERLRAQQNPQQSKRTKK